jgi:hypothetical protein
MTELRAGLSQYLIGAYAKMLKREHATLLTDKKYLGNIKAKREAMIKWAMVKINVDWILAFAPRKVLQRDAR